MTKQKNLAFKEMEALVLTENNRNNGSGKCFILYRPILYNTLS